MKETLIRNRTVKYPLVGLYLFEFCQKMLPNNHLCIKVDAFYYITLLSSKIVYKFSCLILFETKKV